MARVFLINPPSAEPVRTPLLSFCHLAASLRAAGHEVQLADCSAPFGPSVEELDAQLDAFGPHLVGLHIKTLHVQDAYRLAARLQRFTLVAGGPHATVRPGEPLQHGFRYVVRGEGEATLVELADSLDGTPSQLAQIASLGFVDRGLPRQNADRGFIGDLDALASPMSALDLFDPRWYGADKMVPPAGLLSSRGCPAACTFCSNDVTGRKFRYRSAGSVTDEVRVLVERFGQRAFSFFDDSFAVGRRRVAELCGALSALKPVHWTCTAHPAHLDRATLVEMKAAGCGGIDIGMESGDPATLLRIGKGVTVERVLEVLATCHELGIHTVLNLMFGWPDETDEELSTTIAFMERAAQHANGFNARGILVPYPGTPVYEQNHERFGFTDWWLREAPLNYRPFPTSWSPQEVLRCYADDAALPRNFFRHPPERLRRMQEALDRKAELTLGVIARKYSSPMPVPTAGAR